MRVFARDGQAVDLDRVEAVGVQQGAGPGGRWYVTCHMSGGYIAFECSDKEEASAFSRELLEVWVSDKCRGEHP